MDIAASVDRLIQGLETFRADLPRLQDERSRSDFDALFAEAADRLDQLTTSQAAAVVGDVEAAVAALEPRAASFDDFRAEDWLLDSQSDAIRNRPNMREFMDATGASAMDASELLYGVIGSNADLRDWGKIMASGNPVDAARAATGQLYNSDKDYALVNHADFGTLRFAQTLAESSLGSKTVLSQAGNFADIQTDADRRETMAVSSTGLLLRGAGGDDRLFGGDGSDQLRGGSGNDVIDLSEVVSTADRLIFETSLSLNGRDTVYAFAQGASGDVIDIRSFDGANLLAVVTSALVPVATVGGTILRLVLDGLDTATELDGALSSDGAFANLSLGAGTEALVLAADSQATGEDQHLFHVRSTGADLVVSHLATFVGNYLDIDSWHANNFA